jgi:hypothetical protein
MLLLGLLLAGATAAFTGLLIAYNLSGGPEYTVTMFGNDLVTLNHLGAFLAGIALTLVFGLALAMIAAGIAHHRRRSVRLRHARHQAKTAAAERDAMAARLDERDTDWDTGRDTGRDTAGRDTGRHPNGDLRTDPSMSGAPHEAQPRARQRRLHLFGH